MWFRGRKDSDFQAEIESHIRLEADRLIADGMPAAEAQFAARRAFGNVSMAQERFNESQRWQWYQRLGRDLRYGSRLLRKSPAFTAAAALTIALGVGANTAVSSLLDAVLLQLLPVKAPKELVFIDAAGGPPPANATPYPCLAQLPSATKSFAGLAVFATDESRVEIDGKPEQVFGQVASGNYFELLGVQPAAGRLITAKDESLDPPVAVISDRYWDRRFDRDPAVMGKTIAVLDRTYTIVGVTPPEFVGLQPGRPVDITVPIDTSRSLQTYSASLEVPRKGGLDDVYRIVGVVRDTKYQNLREPSPRLAYLSIQQPRDVYRRLTLTATSGGATGQIELAEPIRRKLSGLYPGLLISEVITMRQQVDNTLLSERLLSGLSSIFGVLALILAAIGLYGVLNYRIGQQRQGDRTGTSLRSANRVCCSTNGRIVVVGIEAD